jgi:hypothetical protein
MNLEDLNNPAQREVISPSVYQAGILGPAVSEIHRSSWCHHGQSQGPILVERLQAPE